MKTAVLFATISVTFAFVPACYPVRNEQALGATGFIAPKLTLGTEIDNAMPSIVKLDERRPKAQWSPYVPTVSEHLLFLYYSVSKTVAWTIRRLPFDLKALLRCPTRGSLLILGLFLAKLSGHRLLQAAVLLWVLREATVRILKGVFYPICAGYAVGYTWRMKLAYFHCACPWWIVNKLSEFCNSGGDIEFLSKLCREPLVHDGFRAHIDARRLRPGDIPGDGDGPWTPDLEGTIQLMSDWGGSFVTQLYLFGTRHVFQHDHERRMHLMVSCVAHLMDDYVDQDEDRLSGHFNFFNNHPLARKFPITYWISRLHEIREYYQHDPAMLRFIDGSCAVTTLFNADLYRMVYEQRYSFENPLQPGWLLPIMSLGKTLDKALDKAKRNLFQTFPPKLSS